MLTLMGKQRTSRRDFLRIGALGCAGLSLPQLLQAEGQGGSNQRSVVIIYLPGGPTQHETFDPKPDAPVEIRGAYRPINTRTTGVRFCELLPKLANISDKFSVVRTLEGMANRHESFQCYTGRPGGRAGDNEPVGGWPTLGSVVSQLQGPHQGALPYVDVSKKMSYAPYNNKGIHLQGKPSWPGFTGHQHAPFSIEGEAIADMVLDDPAQSRFDGRRTLLEQLAERQKAFDDAGLNVFQQQALGMLTSNRLADALDLEQEPAKVRERYGEDQPTDPSFGGAPQSAQRLLQARRLIEAGVRCVTLAFGAWDWHANREGTIEYLSQKYLPVFDHAIATFLSDLEERGLLERTTVVAFGEFGRTPRINPKGGRDHWPSTQSVLVAGGGIQGGRIVGQTDSTGGVPAERPVHVQELFATLYHNLGLRPTTDTVNDLSGRPRYLVDNNAQAIEELF